MNLPWRRRVPGTPPGGDRRLATGTPLGGDGQTTVTRADSGNAGGGGRLPTGAAEEADSGNMGGSGRLPIRNMGDSRGMSSGTAE